MITDSQLKVVMPRADVAWLDPLNKAMARFGITTPDRELMFLSQVAVESEELTRLEENLNYTATRIMEVWPHRFPVPSVAASYAHDPQRLANVVYANRLGNGDENSGDGWRYRGRGPINITGADAYRAFGRAIGNPGILLSPDLLLTKPLGALSAAWFFSSRGCNELADREDVDGVTERINGPAKLGLDKRKAYFARGREIYTP